MYKTIPVTLDAKPTDRVIIEHVKALAQALATAAWFYCMSPTAGRRAPTAPTPSALKSTEDHRLSEEGASPEFETAGHSCRGRTGLRRPAQGNREVGQAKGLRPRGHEHPRSPVHRGHLSGHHRHPRSAQHQRAGLAAAGESETLGCRSYQNRKISQAAPKGVW